MVTLSNILDEDLLTRLAGDLYFERGVDYYEQGRVHSLAQYDERVTAEICGTETYQVQLWLQGNDLMSRCTCPLGINDAFCKHCVAVGLAWIAEPPAYRPAEDAPAKVGTTMVDVRNYLAQQAQETLVQMILSKAMEDARWREQLLMKAATKHTDGADIQAFRRIMQNAIIIDDFVDYYAASSYADDVQSAVDGLEDLLQAGYASDVVDLSEEAIALLEDALNSIDDSSGHLGIITDQVEELHYRACEAAQPDPYALAERLFNMELSSGFGFFDCALETYADILGDEGCATYKDLVDAEWHKLPELSPEDSKGNHSSFDYRRSQLSRMKQSLAEATGDLEELVAVISKDLSRPYAYWQIAKLYREHGQVDEAIAWAENGLEAFENTCQTGQLRDFLIEVYDGQSRFDKAIALIWQDFSQRPSLLLYQKLKQQAEKARQWPQWREQSLTHIKQTLDTANQARSQYRSMQRDYSLLVEIFLGEGEIEEAWQTAQSGGCKRGLWLQLADMRSAEHPTDALSVYQREVEPLINATNNQAYSQAVDLIAKIKTAMSQLNQDAKFKTWLTQLSTTYKRKRNFIKFLNQKGLLS